MVTGRPMPAQLFAQSVGISGGSLVHFDDFGDALTERSGNCASLALGAANASRSMHDRSFNSWTIFSPTTVKIYGDSDLSRCRRRPGIGYH